MKREVTPCRRATDERGGPVAKAVRAFYRRLFYCYVCAFLALGCFLLKLPTLSLVASICGLWALVWAIFGARDVAVYPEDDKNDDDFDGGHPLPV